MPIAPVCSIHLEGVITKQLSPASDLDELHTVKGRVVEALPKTEELDGVAVAHFIDSTNLFDGKLFFDR